MAKRNGSDKVWFQCVRFSFHDHRIRGHLFEAYPAEPQESCLPPNANDQIVASARGTKLFFAKVQRVGLEIRIKFILEANGERRLA